MSKVWFWGLGLGGALVALGAVFRREVAMLTGRVIDTGKEAAFTLALPSEARPHAQVILQVARESGLDPFLLAAIGQRESRWGMALKPDGTGDCTPRNPAAWPASSGANGLPNDGLCWGRGIMQVDYGHHTGWVKSNNWRDPLVNVRKGAEILKGMMVIFTTRAALPPYTTSDGRVIVSGSAATRRTVSAGYYKDPRPLAGDVLTRAVIAAYNTGAANALMSVATGRDPDLTTAAGPYGSANYARDVLAKLASYAQAFHV